MYCPPDDYYNKGYSIGWFRQGPVGRFTKRCGIIQPIYRIDTCARILGSTIVSMNKHTATRHLWPFKCYILKIGLVFSNGGFHGRFIGLRKMIFVNDIFLEFFLKTYCLSQHLKKRSPKVGELFSLSKVAEYIQ